MNYVLLDNDWVILDYLSNVNYFQILESNLFSNVVSGLVVGILLARFAEILTLKRGMLGALKLIRVELAFNLMILETLLDGMKRFEEDERNKPHNEIELLNDARIFLSKSTDSLKDSNYVSSISDVVSQADLSEKIINQYLRLHWHIQTVFKMEDWNWQLFENMTKRINDEVAKIEDLIDDIDNNIKYWYKFNVWHGIFNFNYLD